MATSSLVDCVPWAFGTSLLDTGFTLTWQNGFAAADRVDPPRVLGSYRRFRQGPSTPNPAMLCPLLQRCQNASIIGQGCAGLSPGSADREHQIVPHPRRNPSPLRPGLGFRYTQAYIVWRDGTARPAHRPKENSSSTERVLPAADPGDVDRPSLAQELICGCLARDSNLQPVRRDGR